MELMYFLALPFAYFRRVDVLGDELVLDMGCIRQCPSMYSI